MGQEGLNLNPAIEKYLTPLRGIQAYILLLFLLSFYYLLKWPIVALDTDLWYHLNGGRYILSQHSIPGTSFFSFISPPREWVDYYWLFQVLVFKIFSWADYQGLIILRATLYIATLGLVWAYLFRNREQQRLPLYPVLVFGLLVLFLPPRFLMLRPHCFTYLFIVAFLYILEFHPKKVYFLPFLAVLWSNLHGIEYPVMLLILLSYITEFLLARQRKRTGNQKEELKFLVPLVLSLAAVYATPHGSGMMGVPLRSTEFASMYMTEMMDIYFPSLFTLEIPLSLSTPLPLFQLLVALTILSAVKAFWDWRIRASHLLLLAGGLFLLTKGNRFTYEFALLSLPYLRNFPWRISFALLFPRIKLAWGLVAVLGLILPVLYLNNFYKNPPKYPLSSQKLPSGIVAFLQRISAGGSILNHPNNGGYLQWMLYPRYKIFMDMEVPFLFSDEDFFMSSHAFDNEEVLKKIISEYRPSFITVPIVLGRFKEVIKKFPDYQVVFFDHSEVLYLNQKHFPEIAAQYGLKGIDPFELSSKKVDLAIAKRDKESSLKDLYRMLEIYPECLLKNQVIAMLLNKEKQYGKALSHAEVIIKNFPESPVGYRLKGDALAGLNSYDEALSSYRLALDRLGEGGKKGLYKQMGYVYNEQRKFAQAYDALIKATNVFAAETTYKELFDLGATAFAAGEAVKAYSYFRFAQKKVPPEDVEWAQKIREKLSNLESEEQIKLSQGHNHG